MSDPYRVVIADDVADLRFLVQRALERSGRFTVVGTAATGTAAVAQATRHRPDLTLLDLSMPEMDGLEALPLIRAAVPDCTVVVLSGYDAETMEATARDRGAAGYLVKGLSPLRLVDELVALLARLPPAGAEAGPGSGALPAVRAEAHVDFPAEIASATRARAFLRDTLPAWSLLDVADSAMLLTSELVTNAVIHAHSAVAVTLRLNEDRLRVEVADQGPGALVLREPRPGDMHGRGLLLLEALSSAWGTSADGAGKVVWFELAVHHSED